jgi:tetratricopeptide (TPR) repeat protein
MRPWFIIFILCFANNLQAQDQLVIQYIKELAVDDEQQSFRLNKLYTRLLQSNNDEKKHIIGLMEDKINLQQNKYLLLRFSFLKLFLLRSMKPANDTWPGFRNSLDRAKDLNNDILLADGCYWYALFMNEQRHVAEALFYNLKSIELVEKLGTSKFHHINQRYQLLGELLYHTREYEKSIEYSKKALYNHPDSDQVIQLQQVFTLNNIGLAYHRSGQPDSAIVYFDAAAKWAASINNNIWVTIPNANKAQVWFAQGRYQEALPLFEADYNLSMKQGDYPNAANNLQWMAKIYLAENKPIIALQKAMQALQLLAQSPVEIISANTYQTLSSIYQQQNKADSSRHYLLLYNHIHDSLEAITATSRSEIVQLRLNDERKQNKIELLQKDQQAEILKRNAFITLVLLLALVIYLLYNRQRVKEKQQQQLNDAELKAARDQMLLFTKTINEKLELVDSLQQQLERHNLDPAVQQDIEALKQKTILTEQDWEDFQKLFEKIYPGFFDRMKKMHPGISVAELRFAAIIRLQLNNKQAGAMLGISPDSARKTRLRLRQRLNLPEETNLDQVIQAV